MERNGYTFAQFRSKMHLLSLFVLSGMLRNIILGGTALSILAFYITSGFASEQYLIIGWILMLVGSALSLFLTILLSFIEAVDGPTSAYLVRLINSILQSATLIIFLLMTKNLLFYGLSLCTANGITISILYYRYDMHRFSHPLTSIIKCAFSSEYRILKSHLHDFNRFNTQVGTAFLAGYILIQGYTPITAKILGNESAGQWGLTLQIINTISYMTYSLIATQSVHIARSANDSGLSTIISNLFKRIVVSIVSAIVLSFGIFFIIELASNSFDYDIRSRMLSPGIYTPLIFCIIPNQLTYLFAQIFRSRERDPTIAFNIFIAVAFIFCLPLLMHLIGLTANVLIYCTIAIMSFIVYYKAARSCLDAPLENSHSSAN
jgi:hypothetical protein